VSIWMLGVCAAMLDSLACSSSTSASLSSNTFCGTWEIPLQLPLYSHKNRFPSELFCVANRTAQNSSNSVMISCNWEIGIWLLVRAEFFLLPAASDWLRTQPTYWPVPDVISCG
jgi:hypothetical protein